MKRLGVAMSLLLLAASCNPFRRSKPPAPPPAPAQRPVSQPPDQDVIPPPPELPVAEPKLPPAEPPQVTAPKPPPAKPARKTQPKAQPQPQAPAPPQPTPPPAAELPQLRPVLTAEEQRQLNQLIDARLSRARAALAKAPDSATARQVRTFIAQCEEARKTDLLRAASLAERADVLAQQLR